MTPVEFATTVREYTGTDANSFSDARILTLMNTWKNYLCRRVEKKQSDYFTMPQTTPLIAGQREYALPSDMLNRIRRVDIDLIGAGSYKMAFEEKFNILESVLDEDVIAAKFSDSKPNYYILRRALYLLTASAIPAVTNGLRIYASTFPMNWTSLASTVDMAEDPTATSVGFPEPLHELLARKVSIVYKSTRPRPQPLTEMEQAFEVDLKHAISDMASMVKNEKIKIQNNRNNGFQY